MAAEEWDDGAYSGWWGVKVDLFSDAITTTNKGYGDLAWTSDKLDGKNTIVWGDYPKSNVIALTIVWYNTKSELPTVNGCGLPDSTTVLAGTDMSSRGGPISTGVNSGRPSPRERIRRAAT